MQLLARAHNKALIHIICQERCLRLHRVNIISTRGKRCMIRQRCAPAEGSRGTRPLVTEQRSGSSLSWCVIKYSNVCFGTAVFERASKLHDSHQSHILAASFQRSGETMTGCLISSKAKEGEKKNTFNKADNMNFEFSHISIYLCDGCYDRESVKVSLFTVSHNFIKLKMIFY